MSHHPTNLSHLTADAAHIAPPVEIRAIPTLSARIKSRATAIGITGPNPLILRGGSARAPFPNLRSLTSVLDGVSAGIPPEAITVSTYKACRNRAISYLTGKTDFLRTVRGPKIRAFRDNILRPRTSRLVTVDGHMVAAYLGNPNMTMKDAAYHLTRRTQYNEIADAITSIADANGIAPCQAQAILWHARKRIFNIKFDAQTSLLDPFCVSTYPPYPRTRITIAETNHIFDKRTIDVREG